MYFKPEEHLTEVYTRSEIAQVLDRLEEALPSRPQQHERAGHQNRGSSWRSRGGNNPAHAQYMWRRGRGGEPSNARGRMKTRSWRSQPGSNDRQFRSAPVGMASNADVDTTQSSVRWNANS